MCRKNDAVIHLAGNKSIFNDPIMQKQDSRFCKKSK
jgi:hypothetical protein